MRISRQVNLQQWLQQAMATNPINPLKIQGFLPHRDLTTPTHRNSRRWSGLGVVWRLDGWVNGVCGCWVEVEGWRRVWVVNGDGGWLVVMGGLWLVR